MAGPNGCGRSDCDEEALLTIMHNCEKSGVQMFTGCLRHAMVFTYLLFGDEDTGLAIGEAQGFLGIPG